MRLVSSVFALAVLGCCFGPSVEAPPALEPVPAVPSPLSQALQGMGVNDPVAAPPPGAPAVGTPEAPTVPPAAPPGVAAPSGTSASAAVPAAGPGVASTPACADAQAARDTVRAQLAELRMTLGGESSARMESAGAAMVACDTNPTCLRDPKARLARIEVYDRAKAALQAETDRLAQAEVGLYDADQRVLAACGAP